MVSDKWVDAIGDYKLMAAKKGEVDFVFYYAAFMVFQTDAMKAVDMRPGPDRRNGKNYSPPEDVAHEVYKHIGTNDIKLMDCVDCKSGMGQVLGSTFQSEEYWVDGKAAVVHFGRGSNLRGKANRSGFEPHNVQLEKFRDELKAIIGE